MARKARQTTPPVIVTESYDIRPALRARGVVMLSLKTTDGLFFTLFLSRVPCIGEEVFCEGGTFLIIRVQHDCLDEYGHAEVAYHAYLTGSWVPDEDDGIQIQRIRRRKKAAK